MRAGTKSLLGCGVRESTERVRKPNSDEYEINQQGTETRDDPVVTSGVSSLELTIDVLILENNLQ